MVLGLLLLGGCGGEESPPPAQQAAVAPPPPPPPPPPAAPAAPPKALTLAELPPITLTPGQPGLVEVKVERNGLEGPIAVTVADLPEGVTAKPLEIPAAESAGKLELLAAPTLGDAELKATSKLSAKVGEQQAEQPLALNVPKLDLPILQPVADVLVQPGVPAKASLNIERNDYQGPLELRIEGLPAAITAKAAPVAAGQATSALEFAATAAAPDGRHAGKIIATVLGRSIETPVAVQIDKTPYRVSSFQTVILKPGESKKLEVPIERKSYKGPLHLEVAGLPQGVAARAADVPADGTKATIELAASPQAKERVTSIQVKSSGGGLNRVDPMVLRVTWAESGYLPREITSDPEMMHLLRPGSFGGRLSTESKQALLDVYGGTPETEAAVMRGLRWLAQHQAEDGCWALRDYDKAVEGCDCKVDAEKEVVEKADNAGTAFGLLAFLGAGVTHKSAPSSPPELAQYKKTVEKGLAWLIKNQVWSKEVTKDGHLGSSTYAHALGTIALCEAYGLTADEKLKVPAQRALKYLINIQDPTGGGWRYSPRQAGDMSAVGWVFLAIRSGQMAALPIGREPLTRAERFVVSCAAGPEEAKFSQYSYLPGEPAKLSLSAAGILTRQYLGWKRDDPNLLAGVKYLMQNLPPESGSSLGQIYYYYYATQVLQHMEGPEFDLWNHRMRALLLRTQEKEGHKEGSWSPAGVDWGARGGRLYATSLAVMTLQVYYRHLPMYRTVSRSSTGSATSNPAIP